MSMELPNITAADIDAALNSKNKKSGGKKDKYWVRDQYGRLVLFYDKPTSDDPGAFFGRAGTTRQYNDVDVTVVAYNVKPK